MVSVMVLAVVAALIFGGFYLWARRQGMVAAGQPAAGEQDARHVPLLTEAAGYIGAILLIAGGVAAIGQQWDHLNGWGHVGVFAGTALFFFLAGFTLRQVPEPAIQRLASVAWFLSAAGAAGAAGYGVHDLVYPPADPALAAGTVLGTGLAVSLYSGALWLARRHALQNLALFAGLITLTCGAVGTIGHASGLGVSPLAYAFPLWALGLAWAGLGLGRYTEPVWVSIPLGSALALAAPGLAVGGYGWMYVTGILTAAAAMAISVPLRNIVFLGMGTIATFGYVTAAAVTYLHESLGVPATLAITGAVIIGLALLTARLMRAAHLPHSVAHR